MTYRIRVERIGETGAPHGRPSLYEADSEIEAVAIATYEVDTCGTTVQRVATVFSPAGLLVLAYAGRARSGADDARG